MSFLFGASLIDELVDKATSENLPAGSEDMFLNLDIADRIKSKQTPANQAARAIKRRLLFKNPNVQLLAMKLADTCAKNSGAHFLVEVAGKDFMDTLVSLGGSLQLTDLAVRKAALALIQGWGLSFKGKPELAYACEVYETLKREGVPFPPVERAEVSSIMIDTTTAPEWSDSDVCMRCRTQFTTFNRKHHCRNCGQTFCQPCSSKTAPLPHLGITEAVRVCDGCSMKLAAKAAGAVSGATIPRSDSARFKDPAAQKEQDDIEKAIAASLASAGGAAPSNRSSMPPPRKQQPPKPAYVDEEEDEDLKAAIEASLREMKLADESKGSVSYGNAGGDSHGFGSFGGSGYTSSSGAPSAALVAPVVNTNELDQSQIDFLKQFSDVVERLDADVQQRGIGVMSHSKISDLYKQIFALQPKLQWTLEDSVSKYRTCMEMNEKVADSLQMYDRLMQERLNSGPAGYGAPQQYWGSAPVQPQAGYYGAPLAGQMPYGSPQQMQGQYAPQQAYVPQPQPVPGQAWGPPGVYDNAGYNAQAAPVNHALPQQGYAPQPQEHYAPPQQQQQQQQQSNQGYPGDPNYPQSAPPPQQGYNNTSPTDGAYAPAQQYNQDPNSLPQQHQQPPVNQVAPLDPGLNPELQGLQFAPHAPTEQPQAPQQTQAPQQHLQQNTTPPQQYYPQGPRSEQQYTYGSAPPGPQQYQPQQQVPFGGYHQQAVQPPHQNPPPAQEAPLIEF
ncbi:hypothetical protein CcCBS67573_g07393 [Chytriomyces confervae]|uniref:Vacuolar protein sorting-associated protein 27 n=1 Tax=Chytriomyces confervae TaxID=246404 RepID=A0A507EV99_9FUNG|nr:hypothetical protein CcCBS67573_g07393 [Chytriomyces confervae]